MKILRDNCGNNGLFHRQPVKQFKGYISGSEVGVLLTTSCCDHVGIQGNGFLSGSPEDALHVPL